jgi:hypothetical protein
MGALRYGWLVTSDLDNAANVIKAPGILHLALHPAYRLTAPASQASPTAPQQESVRHHVGTRLSSKNEIRFAYDEKNVGVFNLCTQTDPNAYVNSNVIHSEQGSNVEPDTQYIGEDPGLQSLAIGSRSTRARGDQLTAGTRYPRLF